MFLFSALSMTNVSVTVIFEILLEIVSPNTAITLIWQFIEQPNTHYLIFCVNLTENSLGNIRKVEHYLKKWEERQKSK